MNELRLSLIIPFFNEGEQVRYTLNRVYEVLDEANIACEIIAVDDGSSDDTAEVLNAYCKDNSHRRIHPHYFARNFGKESAMLAGLQMAKGDCVVIIDGDLQHPPELIPEMWKKWKEDGFKIVNAVKQYRGEEHPFYKACANIYYKLFQRMTQLNMQGQSDFKLLDREVVDTLLNFPERNRFFRGLVAWAGYRSCELPFRVEEREHGESKWTGLKLLTYSVRTTVAYTSAPLYWILVGSLVVLILSALLGLQTLYNYFAGNAVSGFTTVILIVLILGSFQLLCVGIVAAYISEVYHEVKARPPFIKTKAEHKSRAHSFKDHQNHEQ
ncbi:MAG: glycosyltransferase [Phototrophicales bacterium]|nr:MAG: glycosyltransferase [Phototrophicales bacterium]